MPNDLIKKIATIVGDNGLITGTDVAQRQDAIMLGDSACQAQAIVRPATTDELSEVMKLCHAHGQPVVTHGGRSGLVGGTRTREGQLAISLERMNRIETIDSAGRVMTVQAGTCLQNVQDAAEEAGLFYPVDLGARGSASIGGTIATNAGGNRVLRYGMTRDSILGLEAVLADGTVISSMSQVIKNNTGYQLPQLFIGSEGTLGIVTRAVLRLRPKPLGEATALVAVSDFDDLSALLNAAEASLGGSLSSFEVMWQNFYGLITKSPKHTPPLPASYPYYVILETQGKASDTEQANLEEFLGEALEQELLVDAVVAKSVADKDKIWAIRDDLEPLLNLKPLHAFDISLPINTMHGYIDALRSQLDQRWPDNTCIVFGHLGDGNLHVIISAGEPEDKVSIEELVYGGLKALNGSVSAEHGIGLDKKPYLHYSRSPQEIALMQTLKQAMDPQNILNPNLVF